MEHVVKRTRELLTTNTQYRLRRDHRKVIHGVRAAASDPDPLEILSGIQLVYPDAVFCDITAAWLYQLPYAEPPGKVDVHIIAERHRTRRGVKFSSRTLAQSHWHVYRNLRVTTPLITASDLARLLPETTAIVYLDQVLGQSPTVREELATFLQREQPRHYRLAINRLNIADPRSESPQETRLRLLLHGAGLTMFIPQVTVGRYRLDLADPTRKVAVEYDGLGHFTPEHYARDIRRLNILREHGWVVISITASLLRDRESVIRQVAHELHLRGWHEN